MFECFKWGTATWVTITIIWESSLEFHHLTIIIINSSTPFALSRSLIQTIFTKPSLAHHTSTFFHILGCSQFGYHWVAYVGNRTNRVFNCMMLLTPHTLSVTYLILLTTLQHLKLSPHLITLRYLLFWLWTRTSRIWFGLGSLLRKTNNFLSSFNWIKANMIIVFLLNIDEVMIVLLVLAVLLI